MKQLVKTTLYGSIAAAALFTATSAFAAEPGDFQATLRGATIGIPAGAMPPPGLYGGLETFAGPNGVGKGQAAPLQVFGTAIVPSLLWSTGWNLFGGNVGFVVVQPFFAVAAFPHADPNVDIHFGDTSFFENVHNTIFQAIDSWNWKNGFFTSLGVAVQGPDGSQYNGTLNQDYWTISPLAAISYLDKSWKASANFEYDIHTASAGHTGTYQALASVGALPAALANAISNGYTGGDQLFVDWSIEYRWGKLAFGPAGYFKYQTTSDSPGGGFTCAALVAAALPTCGKTRDTALGGIIGYDFGPAELEAWFTQSVGHTEDDFFGSSVFTRLSFKLDNPAPAPAAAAPMATKAH
jgi:hypothetical protein